MHSQAGIQILTVLYLWKRSIYCNRKATSILLSNDPIIAHYWYQYSRISESGLAYFQYVASSTTKFHATGDTPWSMWPQ